MTAAPGSIQLSAIFFYTNEQHIVMIEDKSGCALGYCFDIVYTLLIPKFENFNLQTYWKISHSNGLKLDWKILFQCTIRLKGATVSR
jgi:hypothetical protein